MKMLALMLVTFGALAGCSEKVQTAADYRGKTDARPYEANFGGDKAKWESELRTRAQGQNEYVRQR